MLVRDNGIVANPSKFQVMCLGQKPDQEYVFEIDNQPIPAIRTVKLLGITIDSRPKFVEHVNALCKKRKQQDQCIFASSKIFISGQKTYSLQYMYHVKIQLLSINLDVLWERCRCSNKQSPKKGTENYVGDFAAPFAELLARGSESIIFL